MATRVCNGCNETVRSFRRRLHACTVRLSKARIRQYRKSARRAKVRR